jgi:tRNA(Arg) A34 adenosine deaminase TadA
MDRRTLLGGGGALLAARVMTGPAAARSKPAEILPDDSRFMQLAIDQAKEADYPFGAVIVRGGRVLSFGQNSSKRNSDPTAHAEMVAIRSFLSSHEPEELQKTTLYSSGEPCVMCMGAIVWCKIPRLVFAASIAELSTAIGQIDITAEQIANAAPFADIAIAGGLLSGNAMRLFASDK